MDENTGILQSTVVFADGRQSNTEMRVLREHILTVTVKERRIFFLVCTKSHLRELVAGRLLTEGLIASKEDIVKMTFCPHEYEASVFLKKDLTLRENQKPEGSCCTENRTFLSGVHYRKMKTVPKAAVVSDRVFQLAAVFAKDKGLHSLTQGTHSCILERDGEILFSCEDIGRHNALDKAVGYALLHDISLSECMVYTSGRVPVDMVEKAIMAGIPVLVSKSVPTADAVRMANDYGLSLICRAWPDSFEIYSE